MAPQSCLKMLKHGHSKVLNAQLRGGVVVVGCQYGLVVLWDLEEVLSSPYFALDIDRESGRSSIENLKVCETEEKRNYFGVHLGCLLHYNKTGGDELPTMCYKLFFQLYESNYTVLTSIISSGQSNLQKVA